MMMGFVTRDRDPLGDQVAHAKYHAARLARMAHGLDPADLEQEARIAVWKAGTPVDPPLVRRIIRNSMIDAVRNSHGKRGSARAMGEYGQIDVETPGLDGHMLVSASAEDTVIDREDLRRCIEWLNSTTPITRDAVLTLFAGVMLHEVALLHGFSESWISQVRMKGMTRMVKIVA